MSDQPKRKGTKRESVESDEYIFEQFKVPRGCLGYLIADSRTRLAAVVDPEEEMVESMLSSIFRHGLRPAYIIDTHTHADHIFQRAGIEVEDGSEAGNARESPVEFCRPPSAGWGQVAAGDLTISFAIHRGMARIWLACWCRARFSRVTLS